MAIIKIHPIKSTLNLAISYIVNGEKTDAQILVSTHKCRQETAHTQFLRTRNDACTNGTVLARHLIQSFLPGETIPEIAHQINIELCKKILKGEYEYVLSTYIDKGHIQNHIIFSNVNMTTGKCYQSNKKSYHQIRYQNDKLCKENNLSVIDEFYETYRKKYKTNGKSWYENEQSKVTNSSITFLKENNPFLLRIISPTSFCIFRKTKTISLVCYFPKMTTFSANSIKS